MFVVMKYEVVSCNEMTIAHKTYSIEMNRAILQYNFFYSEYKVYILMFYNLLRLVLAEDECLTSIIAQVVKGGNVKEYFSSFYPFNNTSSFSLALDEKNGSETEHSTLFILAYLSISI